MDNFWAYVGVMFFLVGVLGGWMRLADLVLEIYDIYKDYRASKDDPRI